MNVWEDRWHILFNLLVIRLGAAFRGTEDELLSYITNLIPVVPNLHVVHIIRS
jgi:hypothetical protein